MKQTREEQKEAMRKQLMAGIGGFAAERRRALHAAALVHGFALVAFGFLFYFVLDARARVARLEVDSIAPVVSRSS